MLLLSCTFIAQTIVTHKHRRNDDYMKSSDAKAFWIFLLKSAFFYVQLFQINCIDKDLYMVIIIQFLNLNTAAWYKYF